LATGSNLYLAASSCSAVSQPGLAATAEADRQCRIGTPATLHHADSVASLTPSSAAITVIVAQSQDVLGGSEMIQRDGKEKLSRRVQA
jgi:hypothetical protein